MWYKLEFEENVQSLVSTFCRVKITKVDWCRKPADHFHQVITQITPTIPTDVTKTLSVGEDRSAASGETVMPKSVD